MDKQRLERSLENKKMRKRSMKERLVKLFVLFLCSILSFNFIYIADQSIKGMMLAKDDKHAVGISKGENDLLRVDIAGEKYFFKVDKIIKYYNQGVQYIKKCGLFIWQMMHQMIYRIKDKTQTSI
jgi:hypothetical protein